MTRVLPEVDLEICRQKNAEKWRLYPPDVLPVWVADMDFEVAPAVREVLSNALERSDWGYPLDPRRSEIPEVFSERMERKFGWSLDPKRVEVMSEVVQAIYLALLQFSEPGDGVLVQTPIYPPFLKSVQETERRLVEVPLVDSSDGYVLDLDLTRSSCTPEVRILLLCNPHNPTGRVFTFEELEALAGIALEHDLIVLSDEIHADLVYPGHTHTPFASLSPEIAKRTVTFYSASKAFNIAGLRCAVAAFGSENLQRRFCGIPRHARGGLSQPGLLATKAAWLEGESWLEDVLSLLRQNRDYVVSEFPKAISGMSVHAPEATYLAWLNCGDLHLKPSPYHHFLNKGRTGFSEGEAFGEPGRDFVRLNFATSKEVLSEVLTRCSSSIE